MAFLLFLHLPWGCSNMEKKVWKKIGNLSLRAIAVSIVFYCLHCRNLGIVLPNPERWIQI